MNTGVLDCFSVLDIQELCFPNNLRLCRFVKKISSMFRWMLFDFMYYYVSGILRPVDGGIDRPIWHH